MSNHKMDLKRGSYTHLGQLAEITMGQSPESSSYNTSQKGLPFLQGCAEFGRISPTAKIYCNPPLRVSKPGSILISVRAPVGTQNWGDDSYCIGRGLSAIKARQGIADTKFLSYALSHNVAFLHRRSQGSTFLAIGANELRTFPIPSYDLNTQCKISIILQSVDHAIDKTEALIKKYNKIKNGMMYDLFTRGLNKDGSLRERYESSPELYQETVVGLIPKEWSLQPLPSISTYQHGRPFPSSDYTDEGVFLLRPGNLDQNGFIRFDEAHSIKIPYYWESLEPNYIVRYGDILMNLTAQSLDDEFLGRVCINMEKVKSMLNQRIARFSTNKIDHEFLYWLLRSRQFRKQIDRTSQGTKVQHLYNRDLNRVILGVPSCTEEQRKIADALRTISEKIKIEEEYLQKLLKDKVGLMQDLLTGKVSVKVNKKDTEASHV